ncbi:MAG: TcdA/TcdB pore-forming domain-containing protein [Candidatus Aquirickettsiella sp.]
MPSLPSLFSDPLLSDQFFEFRNYFTESSTETEKIPNEYFKFFLVNEVGRVASSEVEKLSAVLDVEITRADGVYYLYNRFLSELKLPYESSLENNPVVNVYQNPVKKALIDGVYLTYKQDIGLAITASKLVKYIHTKYPKESILSITDRLIREGWMDPNPLKDRLKDSQSYFSKRNADWWVDKNSFPLKLTTAHYAIYLGNIELSWVSIQGEKRQILDLISEENGLALLQEALPSTNNKVLVNSFIQTPSELNLFFKALLSWDRLRGLDWLQSANLDLRLEKNTGSDLESKLLNFLEQPIRTGLEQQILHVTYPDPYLSDKFLDFSGFAPELNFETEIRQAIGTIYKGKRPIYYDKKDLTGDELLENLKKFVEGNSKRSRSFRDQYKKCINKLAEWADDKKILVRLENETVKAGEMVKDFYKRLFFKPHESYFLKSATSLTHLMYEEEKRSMEILAILLEDESIDLAFRKDQILSFLDDRGFHVCLGGCLEKLMGVVNALRSKKLAESSIPRAIEEFVNVQVNNVLYSGTRSRVTTFLKSLVSVLWPNVNPEGLEVHAGVFFKRQIASRLGMPFIKSAEDEMVNNVEAALNTDSLEITNPNEREKLQRKQEDVKQILELAEATIKEEISLANFVKFQWAPVASLPYTITYDHFKKLAEDLDAEDIQKNIFTVYEEYVIDKDLEGDDLSKANKLIFSELFLAKLKKERWITSLNGVENPRLNDPRSYFKKRNPGWTLNQALSATVTENYQLYLSNIELSWIKTEEYKAFILDILDKEGEFEQLKEILPKNIKSFINSLLQTPADLNRFFEKFPASQYLQVITMLLDLGLDLSMEYHHITQPLGHLSILNGLDDRIRKFEGISSYLTIENQKHFFKALLEKNPAFNALLKESLVEEIQKITDFSIENDFVKANLLKLHTIIQAILNLPLLQNELENRPIIQLKQNLNEKKHEFIQFILESSEQYNKAKQAIQEKLLTKAEGKRFNKLKEEANAMCNAFLSFINTSSVAYRTMNKSLYEISYKLFDSLNLSQKKRGELQRELVIALNNLMMFPDGYISFKQTVRLLATLLSDFSDIFFVMPYTDVAGPGALIYADVDFSDHNLYNSVFVGDLTLTQFRNANLQKTYLAHISEFDVSLQEKMRAGHVVAGLNFKGAIFTTSSFEMAVRAWKAKFLFHKIQTPQKYSFPAVDIRQVNFKSLEPYIKESIEGIGQGSVTQFFDLSYANAQKVDFSNYDFSKISITGASLEFAKFDQVKFGPKNDLSKTRLAGATFDGAALSVQHVFDLYDQGIRDFSTVFYRSDLNLPDEFQTKSLKDAKLSLVLFKKMCERGRKDFRGVDLSEFLFAASRCKDLKFDRHTKFANQGGGTLELRVRRQNAYLKLNKQLHKSKQVAHLKTIDQGLYFPSYEKGKLTSPRGECVAITRGFLQSLFLGQEKVFLDNLKKMTVLSERSRLNQGLSDKEYLSFAVFIQLLDSFYQSVTGQASLPASLLEYSETKTLEEVVPTLNRLFPSGNFAANIILNNHVIAVYRKKGRYGYFDSNIAWVSNIENSDNLVAVFRAAIAVGAYKIPAEGFRIETFKVLKANKRLSPKRKTVLTTGLFLERSLLAEQDQKQGAIILKDQSIYRKLLYDMGAKLQLSNNDPVSQLIHSGMTTDQITQAIENHKISLSATDYLEKLKGKSTPEITEINQAVAELHFEGSRRAVRKAKRIKALLLSEGDGYLKRNKINRLLGNAVFSLDIHANSPGRLHLLQQAQSWVNELTSSTNLQKNWIPILSSAKKGEITFYNPRTHEEKVIQFTQQKALSLEKSLQRVYGKLRGLFTFIAHDPEKARQLMQDVKNGKLPNARLSHFIEDSDAADGLNAAFTIQALMAFFQQKNRQEFHTEEGPLSLTLEIHTYVNLIQMGHGLAMDGVKIGGLVKGLLQQKRDMQKSVSNFRFTAKMAATEGLDMVLGMITIGLDIDELTKAETNTERNLFATQLAFDSVGFLLSAGGAAAGALGASSGAVVALSWAGVNLAGLGIGITGLVQAYSQVAADAEAVGWYFFLIDEAYQNFGFKKINIGNNTCYMSPYFGAVVVEIDFLKGLIIFGSQFIYRTRPRSRGVYGSGYDNAISWPGDMPKPVKDKKQALNIRERLGYPEQSSSWQDCTVWILPYMPVAYIKYDHAALPGATSRRDNGFSVLRKLEERKDFDYDFYIFPGEYTITKITEEREKTAITVRLDNKVRILIVPKFSEQDGELYTKLHYIFLADYSGSQGGQCHLYLNKVSGIELKEHNIKNYTWVLNAEGLSDDTLHFIKTGITVGGIPIEIPQAQSRYYFIDNKGTTYHLYFTHATLVLKTINYQQVQKHRSSLQIYLQQDNLLKKNLFLPSIIVLTHFPLQDDQEVTYQGKAYYSPNEDRYFYTQWLPKHLCDTANLVHFTKDSAYFFSPESNYFWRTNNEHDLTANYVLFSKFVNNKNPKCSLRAKNIVSVAAENGVVQVIQAFVDNTNQTQRQAIYHIEGYTPRLYTLQDDVLLSQLHEFGDQKNELQNLCSEHLFNAEKGTDLFPKWSRRGASARWNPVIRITSLKPTIKLPDLWVRQNKAYSYQLINPQLEKPVVYLGSLVTPEEKEVFYFFAPSSKENLGQLYRQVTGEFPATLLDLKLTSAFFSGKNTLLVFSNDNVVQSIDALGKAYTVSFTQEWVGNQTQWWETVPTYLAQTPPAKAYTPLFGVTDQAGKALAAWYDTRYKAFVLASPPRQNDDQQLQLVYLDRLEDKHFFHSENKTVYYQPIEQFLMSELFQGAQLKRSLAPLNALAVAEQVDLSQQRIWLKSREGLDFSLLPQRPKNWSLERIGAVWLRDNNCMRENGSQSFGGCVSAGFVKDGEGFSIPNRIALQNASFNFYPASLIPIEKIADTITHWWRPMQDQFFSVPQKKNGNDWNFLGTTNQELYFFSPIEKLIYILLADTTMDSNESYHTLSAELAMRLNNTLLWLSSGAAYPDAIPTFEGVDVLELYIKLSAEFLFTLNITEKVMNHYRAIIYQADRSDINTSRAEYGRPSKITFDFMTEDSANSLFALRENQNIVIFHDQYGYELCLNLARDLDFSDAPQLQISVNGTKKMEISLEHQFKPASGNSILLGSSWTESSVPFYSATKRDSSVYSLRQDQWSQHSSLVMNIDFDQFRSYYQGDHLILTGHDTKHGMLVIMLQDFYPMIGDKNISLYLYPHNFSINLEELAKVSIPVEQEVPSKLVYNDISTHHLRREPRVTPLDGAVLKHELVLKNREIFQTKTATTWSTSAVWGTIGGITALSTLGYFSMRYFRERRPMGLSLAEMIAATPLMLQFPQPAKASRSAVRYKQSRGLVACYSRFFEDHQCVKNQLPFGALGYCANGETELAWFRSAEGGYSYAVPNLYASKMNVQEPVSFKAKSLYVIHGDQCQQVLSLETMHKVSLPTMLDQSPVLYQLLDDARKLRLIKQWQYEIAREQFKQEGKLIGCSYLGEQYLLHTGLGDTFQAFGLTPNWRQRDPDYWVRRMVRSALPSHQLLSIGTLSAISLETALLHPRVQTMLPGDDAYRSKLVVRFVADLLQWGISASTCVPSLVECLFYQHPRGFEIAMGIRGVLAMLEVIHDLSTWYLVVGLFVLPQLPYWLENLGIPVTYYISQSLERLERLMIYCSLLSSVGHDTERVERKGVALQTAEQRVRQGQARIAYAAVNSISFFRKSSANDTSHHPETSVSYGNST